MNTTDEQTLIEVCRQVGVGFRAVQGAARTANIVTARRVVVSTLRTQAGWTVSRIAKAVQKAERSVERMLKGEQLLNKNPADTYVGVLRSRK